MKIVFISNYFNHHQRPLSQALYRLTDGNYRFIETEALPPERIALGWGEKELPPYVSAYEPSLDQEILEADVVIMGSAPWKRIRHRLEAGKLTFYYRERVYKEKFPVWKYPVLLVRHIDRYLRYPNLYLLCASGYTAADFAKTFAFRKKAYQWGYFPETRPMSRTDHKKANTLLWVGRFLPWKHPEAAVETARRLKEAGYVFHLTMVGTGEMLDQIREQVQTLDLQDCVELTGPMQPEQVRESMEQSQILLVTSDRNEGWGAVLNEGMNGGCAVVASHAIGAVPFLLEDGNNGCIYRDGDLGSLFEKTASLLNDPERCRALGTEACRTITQQWNSEVAAQRLLALSWAMLQGEKRPRLYQRGVCSEAPYLKDNWY